MSLYSHALLILDQVKWCMNRRQFKDPLKSICQVSSERRVLDLQLEVPGLIFTGGNILLLEFFVSCRKPLMLILSISSSS